MLYFSSSCSYLNFLSFNSWPQGSGCGAVGRAVAYDTRGPGFESSHRQLLLNIYLLLTVCRKDENKEKRPGMAHFFKKKTKLLKIFLDRKAHLFISKFMWEILFRWLFNSHTTERMTRDYFKTCLWLWFDDLESNQS